MTWQQTHSSALEIHEEHATSAQQRFYRLSTQQVANAFLNVLMQNAYKTKGEYSDLSR